MTELRVPRLRHVPLVQLVGASRRQTPPPDRPILDDRAQATHMVVMGMGAGKTAQLNVARRNLDRSVELRLRATSPAFQIQAPRGGVLRANQDEVTLVAGATGGEGDLEVRVGETLVSTMRVRVFPLKRVRVSTWLVRIDTATAQGTAPSDPGIESMFRAINAIWAPTGIEFVVERHPEILHARCATVDQVDPSITAGTDEADAVLGTASTPNALNIYFVLGFRNQPTLLGQTYDHRLASAQHWSREGFEGDLPPFISRPGMIVKTTGAALETLARTVAHEIGHYLSLQHPYTPGPAPAGGPRPDPGHGGSHQFLMHWTQPAGCLIPLRSLGGGVLDDNGAEAARAFIDAHSLAIP